MLYFFLKVSFSILIICILLKVLSLEKILIAIIKADIVWVLAMYGMVLFSRFVEAIQMQVILRKVGSRLRAKRIFMANTLSVLYTFILPGDMLASIAKWANLSAATGKKSVILNAIVYNRLVLLIPPLIIGALALAWDNPFYGSFISEALILMAIASLAVFFWIFNPWSGVFTDKIIRKTSRVLPNAIRTQIEKILSSMKDFRSFRLRDHFYIYMIGIFSMSLRLLVFTIASKAIGLHLSFLTLAWVMALLISCRQLPITLNNLGVREGILMVVLSPYGVEFEKAFALGMIMFSTSILIAFIGLLYQIALTFGLAQWKLNDQILE